MFATQFCCIVCSKLFVFVLESYNIIAAANYNQFTCIGFGIIEPIRVTDSLIPSQKIFCLLLRTRCVHKS